LADQENKGSVHYRQIIWIASYPKSGNTWLRLFLDAYFLNELNINDVVASVSSNRAGLYDIGDGSKVGDLPVDIQHLIKPMGMTRLVRAYNTQNHGIPLFVKSHTAHMIANGVELYPMSLTRAVIFIVRDPRDVLPSFCKHMGCDLDQGIEWMSDKYKTLTDKQGLMADFLSSWHAHTNSFLNADTHNVKVFRYEDMRAEPVKVFSEILRHAGVDPEPLRVRQALKLVELDKLRDIEKDMGFMESSTHAKDQFFGKGEVGGWREKLTEKQQYRIEKLFGRTMKRLGYMDTNKAASWH